MLIKKIGKDQDPTVQRAKKNGIDPEAGTKTETETVVGEPDQETEEDVHDQETEEGVPDLVTVVKDQDLITVEAVLMIEDVVAPEILEGALIEKGKKRNQKLYFQTQV
jgi:hypothetical protein